MLLLADKIARQRDGGRAKPMSFAKYMHEDKGVETVAVLDFSSDRKTMSTVVTGYEGNAGNTVLLKGAPERVLLKCSAVMTASGSTVPLNEKQRAATIERIRNV